MQKPPSSINYSLFFNSLSSSPEARLLKLLALPVPFIVCSSQGETTCSSLSLRQVLEVTDHLFLVYWSQWERKLAALMAVEYRKSLFALVFFSWQVQTVLWVPIKGEEGSDKWDKWEVCRAECSIVTSWMQLGQKEDVLLWFDIKYSMHDFHIPSKFY